MPGPAEANLILRAAALLHAATGTTAGAGLRLHKAIPVAAGDGTPCPAGP